jgi:hypothetical protein
VGPRGMSHDHASGARDAERPSFAHIGIGQPNSVTRPINGLGLRSSCAGAWIHRTRAWRLPERVTQAGRNGRRPGYRSGGSVGVLGGGL